MKEKNSKVERRGIPIDFFLEIMDGRIAALDEGDYEEEIKILQKRKAEVKARVESLTIEDFLFLTALDGLSRRKREKLYRVDADRIRNLRRTRRKPCFCV